ncbi:LIC12162 family protein [Verrucomicrobia bacterium]|nr:LIC12162 family protein [Verrucomicrobiota bacterium]
MTRKLIIGTIPDDFSPETHVALGPWCFAEKEDVFPGWEQLEFPLTPFGSIDELSKAASGTEAWFDAHVMELVCALDLPGTEEYGEIFWRSLHAFWVIPIIQVLYDRQQRLKAAVDYFGEEELDVELLVGEGPNVRTCIELQKLTMDNKFNHWIFSYFIKVLGVGKWRLKERKISHSDWAVSQEIKKPSVTFIRSSLERFIRLINIHLPCRSVKGMRLWTQTLWSLRFILRASKIKELFPTHNVSSGNDHPQVNWDVDIIGLLVILFPARYRSHVQLGTAMSFLLPKTPILTSSVLYDEDSQCDVARKLNLGVPVLMSQHGGNYGNAALFSTISKTEYIANAYITWGWSKHSCYSGNFLALPSPYLQRYRDVYKPNNGRICLVLTRDHLHFYRFDAMPDPVNQVERRSETFSFLNSLASSVLSNTCLRPYPRNSEGELDNERAVRRLFPDMNIVTGNFMNHMLHFRLVVIDHPGTTLNVAMAANMPVLGYWKDRDWAMCEFSEPLFNRMRAVKILFEDAAEAGKHVNEIAEDLLSWWTSIEVQSVRLEWIKYYASASKDWTTKWSSALFGKNMNDE